VTYSNPEVASYINDNMIAYRAGMDDRSAWPLFRANHVIWTPSAGVADHKGSIHYLSVGFSPPSDFLSVLRIGRARSLMAWMRYAEAAEELQRASDAENSFVPEALFWLSTAYYFEDRNSVRMYETWNKLTSLYPDSPWAQHTYPRPPE
jgi:hypothetical protein